MQQNGTPLARMARHCALFIGVLALMICAAPAQAQALRPLPADFLETLKEIDASVIQAAGALKRVKEEDITYVSPTRARLDQALGEMEKSLAQAQGQVGDLRQRESLVALLALQSNLDGFQHDLAAFSSLLHAATVRSPGALAALDKLLAALDQGANRVNAAKGKFDISVRGQLERLDRGAAAPVK